MWFDLFMSIKEWLPKLTNIVKFCCVNISPGIFIICFAGIILKGASIPQFVAPASLNIEVTARVQWGLYIFGALYILTVYRPALALLDKAKHNELFNFIF